MEAPKLPTGWRLVERDTIDSTSDEARRLAEAGAAAGTVVWARTQTGGRGRLGRSWSSPPGNLYTSVILRPAIPLRTAPELSFVAAVAVADALAAVVPGPHRVALKWPNDVLLDGAKISGLLLETATAGPGVGKGAGEGLAFVVLGIGINVASHPSDARYGAIDLAAAGIAIGVGSMLETLVHHLTVWLARWQADGFAPVRAAWLLRGHGRGAPIDVRVGNTLISGSFRDLDGDGAMILDTPGGGHRRITAGDVAARA